MKVPEFTQKLRQLTIINIQSNWFTTSKKVTTDIIESTDLSLMKTNEKEYLSLPSFISQEITGLIHYSNFSLAKNPFSKWKEDNLTTFKNN